jgi:hypothetical protein
MGAYLGRRAWNLLCDMGTAAAQRGSVAVDNRIFKPILGEVGEMKVDAVIHDSYCTANRPGLGRRAVGFLDLSIPAGV